MVPTVSCYKRFITPRATLQEKTMFKSVFSGSSTEILFHKLAKKRVLFVGKQGVVPTVSCYKRFITHFWG